MKIGTTMLEAQVAEGLFEEQFLEHFHMLGKYGKYHLDYYDASIEFVGCLPDLRLSIEQQHWLRDQGFFQCWLQHGDLQETYYPLRDDNCPDGIRKPLATYRHAMCAALYDLISGDSNAS